MEGINLSDKEVRFTDYLKKTIEGNRESNKNYIKCNHCNGTGLVGVFTKNGIYSKDHGWTGRYCSTCRGVGYIDINSFEKCPICNGSKKFNGERCNCCEGIGFIDFTKNFFDRSKNFF